MKRLTDEWKAKKGNVKNRSFSDSIDCDLSNSPDNKKNSRRNYTKRKQTLTVSSLNNASPLVTSGENIAYSPRRSCRLKEKTVPTKPVDKKISNYNEGVSFTFNESFGLQMAQEASRLEKVSLPDDSTLTNPSLMKHCGPTQNTNILAVEKQKFVSRSNNTEINVQKMEGKENSRPKSVSKIKQSQKVKAIIGEFENEIHEEKALNNNVSSVSSILKEKNMEAIKQIENQLNSSDSKSRSTLEEVDCLDLTYWGLPSQVISAYQSRNINKMFQWQFECISSKGVLSGRNLVYSAPTSAGKTLVAEILMLKKVIESKKKAMMILPFVSVVREKVNYFQDMFQDSGIIVGGYMGAHRPPGGFKAVDIAICTIEKANNLINRLMEEKRLDELGILVVDEVHMLGDNSRGYLLELLLTKLLYNCKRNDINIQIIGMSATLPNLNVLAFWLDSELYCTDFRPIPLHEMYKIGPVIYDSKTNAHLRDIGKNEVLFANDADHTIYLAIETVAAGNGVLIFCPSKNWCETLATSVAREIFNVGRPVNHKLPAYNSIGQKLRDNINGSLLSDILLQLKNSPAGLDAVLKMTVPFGVAFHHAGLTFDERDIIEGAFKQGILKVLVATSTLSSGVNLPARRVLIRSPLFCGNVIDTLSYKQMVGRAGRKGIDDQGESILLCKESERKSALQLVSSELQPVKSCLLKSGKDGLHSSLKRALIEVIASGAAVTHEEVKQYASCTLLFASLVHENSNGEMSDSDVEASLNKCLSYLLDNDFIFKIEKKEEDDSLHTSYKPTQLGVAILASGFSPEDSLRVLKELQLARRCFVLENDLHILYEVTPPYLSDQMGSINWMNFLTLWEQLPEDYRRVGELVGVRESFMGLGIQGKIKMNSAQSHHKLAVHQRFYATLALNDLIQETPLAVVSEKYNCSKGILQSLQQSTSTFCGMLTIFCNRLGWYNLELLFSQFQKRVHFGIQPELCDLIQLSTLNAQRARVLYNAGYETVSSLASADPGELELVLCNAGSFESEKQLDGDIAEEAMKRREVKRIRLTGKQGMNESEAAVFIIKEAQNFIKHELGIKTIAWDSPSKQKDVLALHKSSAEKVEESHYKSQSVLENTQNMSPLSSNAEKPISKINVKLSSDAKDSKIAELSDSVKNPENLKISKPESGSNLKTVAVKKELNQESPEIDFLDLYYDDSGKKLIPAFNALDSVINHSKESKNSGSSKEFLKSSQSKICLPLIVEEKPILPNLNPSTNTTSTICNNYNRNSLHLPDNQNFPNAVSLNNSLLVERNIDSNKKIEKSLNGSEIEEHLKSAAIPVIKNISIKNESYFCTEDINDLFDELEKSVLSTKKKKSCNQTIKIGRLSNTDNDLTFNQILLSQSAEMGDVYLAQSFANSDFLEENSFDNNSLIKVNSKVDDLDAEYLSKKSKDVLDAIFDSPISEDVSPRKNIPNPSHQNNHSLYNEHSLHLSNIDAIFDSPTFNDVLAAKSQIDIPMKHVTQIENTVDQNVKTVIQLKKAVKEISINDNEELDCPKKCKITLNERKKSPASQSTPKEDMNRAIYLDNLDFSIEGCSDSPIEKYNFDFQPTNSPKTNMKSNDVKKSDSSVRKSETSGDLFDDSVNDAIFDEVKLEKINPETVENSMQCVSSCSDDIFNCDQSFEKMLNNYCATKKELSVVIEEKSNTKEDHLRALNTKFGQADPIKENMNSESEAVNVPIFSPGTIQEFCLERSGDLFEDSTKSESSFSDPKKQLSFSFEGNSGIFNTWNPSPSKHLQSESIYHNGIVPPKEIVSDKKNNSNKGSFLANMSQFSDFSSNSMDLIFENDKEVPETVKVQNSAAQQNPSSNLNVIESKSQNELTQAINDELFTQNSNKEPHPESGKKNLTIIDVSDKNFTIFLELLEKVSSFSLSVACEKVERKNAVNIGPPKLRGEKPAVSEEIYVNDDILIAGLSFCWDEKVFYIGFPSSNNTDTNISPVTNIKNKLKALQQMFDHMNNKKIIAYDMKSCYRILHSGCNLTLSQNKNVSYLDPSIAAWLLDPSDGQQSLQELVLNYWCDASYLIENFDRGHGSLGLQHWSSVCGRERATAEAYISFHLIQILISHLNCKKLYRSFIDVEMPSILTLARMEQNGLGFDLKLATSYRAELQKKQDTLLKKAHQLAGRKFNIMSSKDLSRILYKEMKLNPPDSNCSPMANRHLSLGITTRNSGKKLPPELKTNKECLDKIMHLHPLPKTVMDWRKLSFAVSQVLMPLLRENKFDKELQMYRLFSTCFVYTVTGRVNMHSPNLQFIPRDFNIEGNAESAGNANEDCYQIDDEISLYGVSLRNIFVPAKGNVLLSADYSQLELRILAHLSGDIKLLKSLNSGDDIFKQIAATWKNISISSVTDELRQQAKKICYGIIYGMSPKTLSHQLKTTENDASFFMETFKKSYPGMTHYLNLVLKNCRAKGYVTTIMERRRYLPHIQSGNKGERSQAERQAVNTTIQGSAADIIKKAMIEIEKQLTDVFGKYQCSVTNGKVEKKIKKTFRGAILVLQLHDELMYEVNNCDLESVKNIVKAVMEKNTRLSVMLPVNIKVGPSWGSMKEVL